MKITIKTFAGLKEILGAENILTLESPLSISDLSEKISSNWPSSKKLLSVSAIAVQNAIVEKDFLLSEDETVYLLPPCSGG